MQKNNPQHLYDEGGFVIFSLNLMTLTIKYIILFPLNVLLNAVSDFRDRV